MPNHFVEHLTGTVAIMFSQVQLTVSGTLSFSSETVLNLASTAVAPCSLFSPSYPCAARSPGGLRTSATSRRRCATRERQQQRLCGCQREAQHWTAPSSAAQATRGRRVAVHSPGCAAALVVNRRAWSALSAAVEPVWSPHRGTTPLRQDRPRLAANRVQ